MRCEHARCAPVEALEGRTLMSALAGAPGGGGASFPLSSVPALASMPGAASTLYLEFKGAATGGAWGSYYVPPTPAYSTDADTASFSQTELDNITQIWQRVAEKYSPFKINVTTVDPGAYAFNEVTRVVVGGSGSWTGGTYGGMSYVNGFQGFTSNTAWVFSDNLAISNHGVPKYVAECIAHEAGHTFGLNHQSTFDANGDLLEEYSTGDGTKAPIMGKSYYVRGVWWNGTSGYYRNFQRDLTVLANTLEYRDDDHPGAFADAQPMVGDTTSQSAAGIIESMTDTDVFRFTAPGGPITLTGDVAPWGAMLDLKLALYDSSQALLATADTDSLGEVIMRDLPAGDYYLQIASHGAYGDIGQYTVSMTVPEPGQVAVILLGTAALLQRRARRGRGVFAS